MKDKLFILLFLCGGVFSIHAATNYAALGIERKVLFRMNKNEVCKEAYTYNPYVGVNDIKSELWVVDTISGVSRFIQNGECVCTGLGNLYISGIDPIHHGPEEMPVKDSIVLVYRQKDGEYIRFGNEVYGPYGYVDYIDWNRFVFSYDCDEYRDCRSFFIHDSDGMIYAANSQGRQFFQSPNKRHSVIVSADNIFQVRIDNVLFKLDSIEHGRHADVSVFDDGSCLIEYISIVEVKNWGLGWDWDVYRGRRLMHYPISYRPILKYYITNGKVQKLSDDQYFDKKEQKIKICPVQEEKEHKSIDYTINDYNGISAVGRDFYEDGTLSDSECAQVADDIVPFIGFSIWDNKHAHHFFGIRGWNYIYIDDIGMASGYPILKAYNSDTNCFRWIVTEGNEIVYYSYKLPK